jgi:hypothetical protein
MKMFNSSFDKGGAYKSTFFKSYKVEAFRYVREGDKTGNPIVILAFSDYLDLLVRCQNPHIMHW